MAAVGKLIDLSSGDQGTDEKLQRINKLGQERHRLEKEIREKKNELKKTIFFFTLIGIFSVLFFLLYVMYGLWKSSIMAQRLALYSLAVCAVAIAFWLSRNIYKFIFYRLE